MRQARQQAPLFGSKPKQFRSPEICFSGLHRFYLSKNLKANLAAVADMFAPIVTVMAACADVITSHCMEVVACTDVVALGHVTVVVAGTNVMTYFL